MVKANKLTQLQATRLKEPGLHGDGAGLWLKVTEGGSKSWILRYAFNGRERWTGLGPYPEVSLADARDKAMDWRRQVRQGIDPMQAKHQAAAVARAEQAKTITFDSCAERYIESHRSGWKNAKHADQWTNTLQTYAAPIIGKMDVALIETAHSMRVLEPVWHTKAETASRLRGRLEAVLDWATVHRYRTGGNPARWKGHLDNLLAAPAQIQKIASHKAVPYKDMAQFMADLRTREGLAARALEFAILCAARSGEVRGALWSEINREKAIWTIPAERMKAGKEHRVPLCASALSLLSSLPKIDGSPYLFAGQRKNKPLSNQAMTMTLRRMGRGDLTVHGFRSTFRDWAAEQTSYSREVCELSLAHKIADGAEAAYWRSDIFEKRSRLMSDWAQYANGQSAEILRLVV